MFTCTTTAETDFTRAAFESNIKNGTRFSENLVVIHNNVKLDPSMTLQFVINMI